MMEKESGDVVVVPNGDGGACASGIAILGGLAHVDVAMSLICAISTMKANCRCQRMKPGYAGGNNVAYFCRAGPQVQA